MRDGNFFEYGGVVKLNKRNDHKNDFMIVCLAFFGAAAILGLFAWLFDWASLSHSNYTATPSYQSVVTSDNSQRVQAAEQNATSSGSGYYISKDRADKYFGSGAREEMANYLKSQSQPPASSSDIDFLLKVNERAEHYSGN